MTRTDAPQTHEQLEARIVALQERAENAERERDELRPLRLAVVGVAIARAEKAERDHAGCAETAKWVQGVLEARLDAAQATIRSLEAKLMDGDWGWLRRYEALYDAARVFVGLDVDPSNPHGSAGAPEARRRMRRQSHEKMYHRSAAGTPLACALCDALAAIDNAPAHDYGDRCGVCGHPNDHCSDPNDHQPELHKGAESTLSHREEEK